MRRIISFSVLGAFLSLTGCSSTSDTTSDTGDDAAETATFATIDALPKATSPVVEDASGSYSFEEKSLFKSAATGMPLGELAESSFTAASSMAACETGNKLKQLVSDAAQGDMILCFIQAIAAANGFDALDLYDGSFHTFTLDSGGQDDDMPTLVKMRINKTGDSITLFEMFACNGTTQMNYLNQAISGNTFTMNDKGTYADTSEDGMSAFTGAYQTDVTGTLNSAGRFTAKTVVSQNNGTETFEASDYTHQSKVTMEQGSDTFTLYGFDTGTYPGEGVTGSYTNRGYGISQLIEGNVDSTTYDIGLLAMGDGALQYNLTSVYAAGDNGTWTDEGTTSWDGDTLFDTDSNDYTAGATAGTAPEVEDISISFAGDEVYTCDDTPDATVTVDPEAIMAACSAYSLGHTWINCYDIIESGGGGDGDDGDQQGPVDLSGTYITSGCGLDPQSQTINAGAEPGLYSILIDAGDFQFSYDGSTCSIVDTLTLDCEGCSVFEDGSIDFTTCDLPDNPSCTITQVPQ